MSREGAGIQCASGKYGIRLPGGTAPRTCTISKACSWTQQKENGQLPLPEPNSAATTTFDLLMILCQIKLDVTKSHRNTKCHVLSSVSCISPHNLFSCGLIIKFIHHSCVKSLLHLPSLCPFLLLLLDTNYRHHLLFQLFFSAPSTGCKGQEG